MKTVKIEWSTYETHSATINVDDDFDPDSDDMDIENRLADVSDELETWDGEFERQDVTVEDEPFDASAPYFNLSYSGEEEGH